MSDYDPTNIERGHVFKEHILTYLSFDLTQIVEYIGGFWGVSRALLLSVIYLGLLGVLWRLIPDLPQFAAGWFFGTLPIWLPVVAVIFGWASWVWYVRAFYIASLDNILLEVKFPRNIVRSPRAMEQVLTKLWTDSGETTFFNRIFQGQVRPWFSLEMASFGGDVHFYIWCRRSWRHVVEAAMYAHYPEVELFEAEDYASKFKYDPDKYECFCTDWRLEPKIGNDAYSFRTYVDFELDQDPKEEYKIDPLAQVIERLSTLKPSEQMWIQIIITQNSDKRRKKGSWLATENRYVGLIKDEIENIRKTAVGETQEQREELWRRSARVPQYRQSEQVRSMDRQMGKLPFSVGARGIYIAPPDVFNAAAYTGIRWIWRPIANPQWANQMRPRRWHNPFDYPWQDWGDLRWMRVIRYFLDCYRRRSHFYTPWILPYNMMSTEAIATLWHPPSEAIVSPGLERIPAKKAEPPPNLPK